MVFTQVETSQICAPMDRYESRMKLVSDCIRSHVFIWTSAGAKVYEMRVYTRAEQKASETVSPNTPCCSHTYFKACGYSSNITKELSNNQTENEQCPERCTSKGQRLQQHLHNRKANSRCAHRKGKLHE